MRNITDNDVKMWAGDPWQQPHEHKSCEHCFCQEEMVPFMGANQKLHIKCCMCGTRTIKRTHLLP